MKGAERLLADLSRQRGRPSVVTFQVTDRCNYSCAHCYQEHDAAAELTYEEIARILEEIADEGILMLTLVGGEFFMRRDADAILERAHELGFVIKLKTTGHHIDERRADLIARMRPIQVDMSLYAASAHVHEDVTRQAGSWQRTHDAARRLLARKVPVQLNTPVMESNASEVEALRRLAAELGAHHSVTPEISAMETGSSGPTGLRMRWSTLSAFFDREASSELVSMLDAPERMENPGACGAGQYVVAITPQGDVKPCTVMSLTCGNLRERSFGEIWSGSEMAEVRGRGFASLAECSRCALQRYCKRCHAVAMFEHGDFRGPSLEACRIAVALRQSLQRAGLVPDTETQMPPTWDRVDLDGQHGVGAAIEEQRRPASLRVIR